MRESPRLKEHLRRGKYYDTPSRLGRSGPSFRFAHARTNTDALLTPHRSWPSPDQKGAFTRRAHSFDSAEGGGEEEESGGLRRSALGSSCRKRILPTWVVVYFEYLGLLDLCFYLIRSAPSIPTLFFAFVYFS